MTRESALAPVRRVSRPALRVHRMAKHVMLATGITVTVLSVVTPLLYLGLLSVTSQAEVLSGRILPQTLIVENWRTAFAILPLWNFLSNSVLTAIGSSLLTLILSFPLAYAVVRLRTGGRALPSLILASYTAPPIVAAIPIFFTLRRLGLIDTTLGLILVYGAAHVPVAFYLLENFIQRIPEEIEHAAWLDGASILQTLVKIVFPLALPGLVATGIICGILAYNEFLFALLFTYTPRSQTLPVAISLFQGDRLVQFGQMAVASLVGIAPVYLFGALLQRWLIGGLTGGVK